MTEVIHQLLGDIFSSVPQISDSDGCPACGKTYKTYNGLSRHIQSAHPGLATPTSSEAESSADLIKQHSNELLKILLLKRVMDHSISHGDGQTMLLVVKYMLLYFKALGCTKYAVASFEFVAQQQIFLSEKMATLVRQEQFVNNRGRSYTNMPVDLDVEHSNKFF